MRRLPLVGLLMVSTCWAQEASTFPLVPQIGTQAPVAPQEQTLTLRAGTRIPLALAGPITTKSRPGNTVRAVTGFPVTVGTQVVIPVGAYVEGVIDKITRGGRSGSSLQMHFTRILFASGYSVAVDGTNTQAKANSPSNSTEATAFTDDTKSNNLLAAQQLPGGAPGPLPAPHYGVAIGLAVGAAAGGIVIAVLAARHHGAGSSVLFDSGWQFEMVLQSALSVNAASVAAAVAVPHAP